jgi:PII-like signaling protein
MHLPEDAELLRIFIGESDKHGHEPLYEAIVRLARRRGLAGATVLRGVMGFGADSRLHTAKILRLSEDLPIVIEIVDRPERIDALLEEIDPMIVEGLVTRETVRVVRYRSASDATQPRTSGGTDAD